VCVDGNFGHKHNVQAGNCPPITSYLPRHFVPAIFIDAVDVSLREAGQRQTRRYNGRVPDEVIDECKDTHTAANGSRVKAGGEMHDDRGLMALVCRHDIPLVVCNIDTVSEQSKYAIGLLIWFMLHLPDNATTFLLYDIACVTARTVALVRPAEHAEHVYSLAAQYGVLGPSIEERVVFCTAAMHSFVHAWFCQLHFAPRFKKALGFTDGEGVERLWSRLCKLIPILRHVHVCVLQLTGIGVTDACCSPSTTRGHRFIHSIRPRLATPHAPHAVSPSLAPAFSLTICSPSYSCSSRLYRRLLDCALCKNVQRQRRIVMLDWHLSWIAEALRVDLSRWIARRYKLLQDKEKVAHRLLRANGHTFEHLREQWDLQQGAQMSVRKSTHRVH